jgi:hypothetical protein
MYQFCTYFDRNYLVRGLTLFRSLTRHAEPFVLWVLCFDDFTHDVLSRLGLPNLRPVRLQDFERGDEALLAAKKNRSQVEYYFTCTPSWPLYILNHYQDVDLITYVDADLFFYSSPAPIYEELGEQSALIIGHRFPEQLRHREKFGIYNVGLLCFRDDPRGRECLQWWRDRCLEWCYDRVEDGRFADQKYLDDWPARFQGVVVLQHKGAGVAPWNWMNYAISIQGNAAAVDAQPLIFYHFHGLKMWTPWLLDLGLSAYGRMPSGLRRRLYAPYVRALKETCEWLRAAAPGADPGYVILGSGRDGIKTWFRLVRALFKGQVLLNMGRLAF